MKNIKLNLTQRPSLYRIGKAEYRFDGSLNNLFTEDEVIQAYEIINEINDEEVVMASALLHLFQKAYAAKSEELSGSEQLAKLRYTQYSPVQDALLRFATSRALELVESLPVAESLTPLAHRERFLSAFELLSQKYQLAPKKILPIELLGDSNSRYWKLMYKLLSDRKVYSNDMSPAMFSDLVEHYALKTNLAVSNPVPEEFFDQLSSNQTFRILKVSRVVKQEVPYLETKEKSPFSLMKESKILNELDRSFQRFVDISSYSAIGLHLASIVEDLLENDKCELLKMCSECVPLKRPKVTEHANLDLGF
ncbi:MULTISPECIES: hypothetical protein [unclassified Marinobacterium]|uniref:hypothetical protein n=1 Tax=unclassified Marinobacterium TaxID=2644139 RepID=UPI001569E812|nr:MULTISPECIES: hypothetical protein [unclassified Marinobacterium]NRP11211.1 hypothetical protein [Marinobacterium sp. xm-g-48]NRP84074.1 hypothetical protein [Marinobacterium sp. xm-d-509]